MIFIIIGAILFFLVILHRDFGCVMTNQCVFVESDMKIRNPYPFTLGAM